MSTFVASLIRQLVPLIVGALLSWLTVLGLNIDAAGVDGLAQFLTLLFSGVYYALVRLVEEKVPAIGWLLGLARSPDSYSKGKHIAGAETPLNGL